ncbi:FmdB family zinc ribbon protein [Actinopolymorpha alba]|uniref:FmdB family zinc ribbon protein n=1 Tax=Actinopolymorpha alba TaxID=533267 RepID=UPI000361A53F|nr:FmdB family zinc ribbon protein [Actinopolymorpha alba]
MPTYQYACVDCDEQLEVVQKFTDDPLTQCPSCQGHLRKVFSAVGVVFKGSGFYRNDSRSGSNGSSSSSSKSESSSGSSKDSSTDSGKASSSASKDSGSGSSTTSSKPKPKTESAA